MQRKCYTKYCRREARPGGKLCPSCARQRLKENNPIYYTYQTTKDNAKRRGKRFVITLDEFAEFCTNTGYLELKGKDADSASIDCIIDEIGYAAGNIRVLSLRDNTLKRWRKVLYDWETKQYYIVDRDVPQQSEDNPF